MADVIDDGRVWLPADRALSQRASQTFLRHANGCMRSGYLYALHKGDAPTMELMRGSAGHAALERTINHCLDLGERTAPTEVAKSILEEVLADPAFPVPMEEHDYLRECVARWAASFEVDVENVISVERLFVLDVDGWEVRAKVDYAVLQDNGRRVHVADWKFAKGAASRDDVARQRPDGTLMARSFQLVLYALVVAFGVPVRVEALDDGSRVETRELPVARAATEFTMDFVYPGIPGADEPESGQRAPLRRSVSLTRVELEETRASLTGLLRRVAIAEQTGVWSAVLSDSACGQCPAKLECPIPAELRAHRGTINTLEEAAEAATRLDYDRDDATARMKELKAFADAMGVDIRFGKDKALRFVRTEKTEVRDRDAMFAAMDRAVQFGEEFDRSRFVKKRVATEFKSVTLSDDELAAEEAAAKGDGDGDD